MTLEQAFKSCRIDILLPLHRLTDVERRSLDIKALLARLHGEQRQTLVFDEDVEIYVQVSISLTSEVTLNEAVRLFDQGTTSVTAELRCLESDNSNVADIPLAYRKPYLAISTRESGTASPILANRDGPGAQTPGFPHTPTPLPSRPSEETVDPYVNLVPSTILADVTFGSHGDDRRWMQAQAGTDNLVHCVYSLRIKALGWRQSIFVSMPLAITCTLTHYAASETSERSDVTLRAAGRDELASNDVSFREPPIRGKSSAYLPVASAASSVLSGIDHLSRVTDIDPAILRSNVPASSDESLSGQPIQHHQVASLRKSFRRVVHAIDAVQVRLKSFAIGPPNKAHRWALDRREIILVVELTHNLGIPAGFGSAMSVNLEALRVHTVGEKRSQLDLPCKDVGGEIHPPLILAHNDQHNFVYKLVLPSSASTRAIVNRSLGMSSATHQLSTANKSPGVLIECAIQMRIIDQNVKSRSQPAWISSTFTSNYSISLSEVTSARAVSVLRRSERSFDAIGDQPSKVSILATAGHFRTQAPESQTFVQATAGRKRFSLSNIDQMPKIQRHISTSGKNVAQERTMSQAASIPKLDTGKTVLPRHLSAEGRPGPPKRSFTMPTVHSPAATSRQDLDLRSDLIRPVTPLSTAVAKGSADSASSSTPDRQISLANDDEAAMPLLAENTILRGGFTIAVRIAQRQEDGTTGCRDDLRSQPRVSSRRQGPTSRCVGLYETVTVELYISNEAVRPLSLDISTFNREIDGTLNRTLGLLPLDTHMHVIALQPQAAQSLLVRYTPISLGIYTLPSMQVVDTDTGFTHIFRDPLTVVVM